MGAKREYRERQPREKRIVAADETADLRFRETLRVSEYRELLEQLEDAPNGSTLKISKQARCTVTNHVRALGLKVLWAKRGEDLYLKIVGHVDDSERPLDMARAVREAKAPRPAAPAPPVALGDAERRVMRCLEDGPKTLKEIARALGAAPTSCAPMLSRMAGARLIENDEGVYRRLGGA